MFLPKSGSPDSPLRRMGVPLVSLMRLMATYTRPVIGSACADEANETSKRGPAGAVAWAARHAGSAMMMAARLRRLIMRKPTGSM